MRLEVFRPKTPFVWRDVHWPAALAPDAALAFLRQLATDYAVQQICFEVEATPGGLSYRVGVRPQALERVEQLLDALVPGSAITVSESRSPSTHAWKVALSTANRPLQTTQPETVARALLAAITSAGKGEAVVVQWLLGRAHPPRPVAPQLPASSLDPWWRPLVGGTEGKLDSERRRALEVKRADHAFASISRIAVRTRSREGARSLAVSVLAGLRVAETPGLSVRLVREQPVRFDEAWLPWRWPYVLNVSELLGLLGWPLGDQPMPGIERSGSRWLRPDPRVRPARRVLGVATAPGESREVGLSIDDARQHLHVIGPTGTGKSTLLANLILQDIKAGRGVVVIEPKGDLIQDVLARIPAERVDDVVVLDPTEAERPVGLNPLQSRGRRPELVADQVLAVFHGLYEQNWGPRMQDILHASLLTLAERGDSSLCALPALLTSDEVRRRFRSGIDDPIALEPFWAWFESISDAERQQAVAPVLNKLRPFLLRKSVRAIVGQVDPLFRIDEVFTKRKIVLCSLAKGLIGPEASALLGSLLVAELWQAVLGRASVPPAKRHPVVVYADEFQDYVHLPTDMADALAQARGLGVGLTLAHQHLAQLPATLRSAVLANARSRVCFQLSGEDAQAVARLSGGALEANDLQRLPRFNAYAQVMVGGELTQYASIRTVPLDPPTNDPQLMRRQSASRYGRPVAEVDDAIRALIEGAPNNDERVGRRRRGER